MVKSYTLLLLLVIMAICQSLPGQITVTNAIFPTSGDTIKRVNLALGATVSADLGASALDQSWDLSDITGGTPTQLIFDLATNGSNADAFPEAELVSYNFVGGPETYYDVYNNRIDELGVANQNFGFGAIELPLGYTDVPVYARAPMSYNDVFDDITSGFLAAPKEIIPDSILALIPPFLTFDSIRVTLDVDDESVIDNYGTITIPGGTYDVLRETVTSTSTTTLDLYIPLTGSWQTITPQILELLGDFADFFGEQEVTTYNFFAADVKGPVVSATYNDNGLQNLSYLDNGATTSTNETDSAASDIRAYPNPTLGPLTIDVGSYGPGDYRITVYNIVGMEIINEPFTITNGSQWKTNVGSLRKGTYIYTIHDEDSMQLGTKRFIVLKP